MGSYARSRLTRLICARSRDTLIICHPASRVTENPFAMRVFCSALLCSWQRRQKIKQVRDWPERLSFIFNSLFSSPFLSFIFSVLVFLRTRHLEPWNTRENFPYLATADTIVVWSISNAGISWELFLFTWLERNEDLVVEYQRNSCRSKRQIFEGNFRLSWSWCYLFARNESYPWVINLMKGCYV